MNIPLITGLKVSIHTFFLAGLLLTMPATAGVYAHYSFDSSYADSSGNSRNGTLTDVGTIGNSAITSTPGNFKFGGGAMNFSADRDYVAIPSKTFSSGVAYSFAFWAKKAPGDTGESSQFDMVMGQRDVTGHFIALNDATGSNGRNGFRWRGNDSTTARQADFSTANDTNWHHYAVTASGTSTNGTITLYVDGVLSASATDKLTGFTVDTIGEAYPATNDFDFNGQIDEMWIFDETLTAAKVAGLYNSNDPNALPTYNGFHHRYDGNFADSSGAGNGGTAVGTAGITTDPAAIAAGTGALLLDGADGSYVSLTTPGAYGATASWSAAWWARRGELGANKGMVLGTAGTTNDFIWLNDLFNGLRFRSSTGATLDFTSPKDQALRHYALIADGTGNLTLYLDGQPAQTLTGNTSFAMNAIGNAFPTTTLHYNFQGSIDELHVYNTALGASQVQQLYNSEKPAPPVTRLRIVLLAGQSNADGRATISGLPTSPVDLQSPQPDVDLFYKVEGGTAALTTLRPGLTETAQFGPEITLGRKLADLWSGETGTRIAIIKYANGGTNLAVQWKGGGNNTTTGDGPEYVTFQQTITAGLAALAAAYPGATQDLQGLVWLQGESDAVASYASSYQANLTTFVADVRATYGSDLPFTIARLSSGQTNLTESYLNQVRAAQDAVAAADPRTGIIFTDSFGLNADNLHFNTSGQQAIGSGFAENVAYYEWMMKTFTNTDINSGLAEPDADRDGDGQSNRSEFLGGTNPLSWISSFGASYARTGPAAGQISYPSATARIYSVQRYGEISKTWEALLTPQRGTGSTVVRPLDTSAPSSLFRVTAELP